MIVSATTRTVAIAHVLQLVKFSSDGPFLACATSRKVVGGTGLPIIRKVGGEW